MSMVTVKALTSFTTYVGNDCVSVTQDQTVMLPKEQADSLTEKGLVESLSKAKGAPENKEADVKSGEGRIVSFLDQPVVTPFVDEGSATYPRASKGIVESTKSPGVGMPESIPAEVDKDQVKGDRAAQVIKDTTKAPAAERGLPVEDPVPAEVDETVAEGDRAAEAVRVTTEAPTTQRDPVVDNTGEETSPSEGRPSEAQRDSDVGSGFPSGRQSGDEHTEGRPSEAQKRPAKRAPGKRVADKPDK